MSLAYRCEVCEEMPKWSLTRHGDVVVSWACVIHVDEVLDRLQRDWEVTEISVVLSPKAREWAEIKTTLNKIAEEGEVL